MSQAARARRLVSFGTCVMADDMKPKVRPNEGVPGIHRYAGGWGALKAVAGALTDQETVIEGGKTLLRANQPEGFDCPGCAWPDPKHTSSFEFCENGAKAVAWEATASAPRPRCSQRHTVSELLGWSDHDIEDLGRLTHPMAYDAADRPLCTHRAGTTPSRARGGAAGAALARHGGVLYLGSRLERGGVPVPAVRPAYGTNNFPDCSNMCHEADQRRPAGLDRHGQGHGDAGGLRPRRPDPLLRPQPRHQPSADDDHAARRPPKRGATILVFNPLRERALERFAAPQDPIEMATLLDPDRLGLLPGEGRRRRPALQGMMKAVLALDAATSPRAGRACSTAPSSPSTRRASRRWPWSRADWDDDRGGSACRAPRSRTRRAYAGAKAPSSATAWA
jgi:hypothetical protein